MADFEKKLGYTAGGADPEDIKTNGFQAGYKPPATFFNWLFTRTSDCIDELQEYCLKRKIHGYTAFEQLGISAGSETIRTIATSIPDNSYFFAVIDRNNAGIYPATDGFLIVSKKDNSRAIFEFYEKSSIQKWYGCYDSSKTTSWTGWEKNITQTEFDDHALDQNNPHNVTAEQIGIDLSDFEAHLRNKENPHEVTKAQVGLDKVPNKATHVATYYTLGQIGVTRGSETIEDIATSLPDNSELITNIGASNAEIYPQSIGILRVMKTSVSTTVFRFWADVHDHTDVYEYVGIYSNTFSEAWTGWLRVTNNKDLEGYLPLTGGTINGNLSVVGGFDVKGYPIKSFNDFTEVEIQGLNNAYENGHHFLDINLFGTSGLARMRMNLEDANGILAPVDLLQVMTQDYTNNNVQSWYKIHHGGNKPSGNYYGNNTARTLKTGGIGNVIMIWSGDYKTIVTPAGGFAFGSNTGLDAAYSASEVKFVNGELIIGKSFSGATEPSRLNAINNEQQYTYQVL